MGAAASSTTSHTTERLSTGASASSLNGSSYGPDGVWYFAYGSNMNEDTLKRRRQVYPLESHPASLRGWTLSFRMLGLPYAEPGFATIERVQSSSPASASTASASGPTASGPARGAGRWGCEVHGVLHRLRPADWVQVMATEGVGAGNTGYRVVEVDVMLYDGRTSRALTLEGLPGSLHSASRPVAPSRRYLELLRTGARHHGLDPEYVSYLDSLQPYDRSGWAVNVGRMAALSVALPLALPVLPPILYLRYARKKAQQEDEEARRRRSSSGGVGDGLGGGGSAAAGSGPLAAASAAATAAKYASDLPSKAAAATAVAAPLPAAATEAAITAVESAAASAAAPAATRSAPGGAAGGSVPAELLRPPLVLPAVLSYYVAAVQWTTWVVHDVLGAPLLGSGSTGGGGTSGVVKESSSTGDGSRAQ